MAHPCVSHVLHNSGTSGPIVGNHAVVMWDHNARMS
jgi:hypothetical protein